MKNKKHYKDIFDKYFKEFDTQGLCVLKSMCTTNKDGNVVYFEIQQWIEEKDNNLCDYTYIVVDNNDNVIYDEADGELTISQVMKKYYQIVGIQY